MPKALVPALAVLALCVATVFTAANRALPDLTVHEWGTFTTVAGEDGSSLEWLPLGGPTDLPCFVNHLNNNPIGKVEFIDPQAAQAAQQSVPPRLTYEQARASLRGTVRMETPVLYFYAADQTTVDVSVRFPRGLITEWYPRAAVSQPAVYETTLRSGGDSTISWKSVTVIPGAKPGFPTEAGASHYYAARETDAAPVGVGTQYEKFLFYRGVGGFQAPVATTVTATGAIRAKNLGDATIPNVVLFENRDGKIGYRIQGALRAGSEVTIAAPPLTGDVPSLRRDLVKMLTSSGLYAREAQAMVDTWRDSWFEAGTRVFYIVPGTTVDAMLPLTVGPTPKSVARAFVGRMEVITPETLKVVADAIAEADGATLEAYGRFLGPISDRLLANADSGRRARTLALVSSVYQSYVSRLSASCR